MRSVVLCMGVAVVCIGALNAKNVAYFERVSNQTDNHIYFNSSMSGLLLLKSGKTYDVPGRRGILKTIEDSKVDPEASMRRQLGEIASRVSLAALIDHSPSGTTGIFDLGWAEYRYVPYLHDSDSKQRLVQQGSGEFRPELIECAVQIFCRITSTSGDILASWTSEKLISRIDREVEHALHLTLRGKDLRESEFEVFEIEPNGTSRQLPKALG